MSSLQREGFRNPTKVDDALRTFFDALGQQKIKVESVKVEKALGRVLGQDVVARQQIPRFDLSVMDGYAVHAEDVQGASETSSVILKIAGESRIGEICRTIVKTGEAVAVATGSMIPRGADAVVIVERVRVIDENAISVHSPAIPGEHISRKGEDVSPGTKVLSRGRRLRPQDIGILRRLGVVTVRVVRKPRVAIMSTGNELVNSARKNSGRKIVDINRPILSAMIRDLGAKPVDLGIARDKEEDILRILRKSLKSSDLLLVSAGSSVGKRDLVPRCINRIGKPGMLVHGIAMRPALPTGLAIVNRKPVLSLPGFPVSTIFAFRVFGRPLVARLMGTQERSDPVLRAVLGERVIGSPGFRTFVRVSVKKTAQGLVAEPLKLQRSSVLMSMVGANGIVTVPEGVSELDAGQEVEVSMIGELAA